MHKHRSALSGLKFGYRLLAWVVLMTCVAGSAYAADWPTYRHDNARSGATTEELRPALTECWTFRPRHAPSPAWEPPRSVPVEGILELPRVRFDDAYHVAVVGSSVYFGSSSDNKVYALDAATGKVRWTRFTGGPVRLAPTVVGGRVYVGSDDGLVYCLSASDGQTVWQRRVGPNAERLLGHGKMISRWPLRTGVIVDKGLAYCGAGIFPAEGVYIEAVSADDGKIVWRNDTCGETTDTSISPQGYLLASASTLFVPQGRVSPAAFDRSNGRLVHTSYFGKNIGGTYAMLAEDKLYTGTEEVLSYHGKTRGRFAWFQGRQLIVTPDVSYMTSDTEMVALSRKTYPKASLRRFSLRARRPLLRRDLAYAKRDQRKAAAEVKREQDTLAALDKQIQQLAQGDNNDQLAALNAQRTKTEKTLAESMEKLEGQDQRIANVGEQQKAFDKEWESTAVTMTASANWRVPCECPDALILAGSVLYAGGQDQVIAVDAAAGKKLWAGKVDGKVKGLAVASGRLFVSTDTGAIHCFGAAGAEPIGQVAEPKNPDPYPRDRLTPVYEAAADTILRQSGAKRGYCLVLGSETGRLAYELSKRTDLMVYGVEPDPAKVAAARAALDAAGVYGARVCVDQGPLAKLDHSDYFANLIVSERALLGGTLPRAAAEEILRVLKPHGGVALIGQPAEAKGRVKPFESAAIRQALQAAGAPGCKVAAPRAGWAQVTRGALPGAGKWTHQYADAGNTACSDDQIVKCPLGLLWFGDPGPLQMISRHRRAAAPLSANGVLFVQGEHSAMGFDPYNGLKLWERNIPNVVRASVSHNCSNLAADDESFYVVAGSQCFRLDGPTGDIRATYAIPEPPEGQKRRWGYVAYSDGLLFGSRTAKFGSCDSIFAIDVATGKIRWSHTANSIPHPSISIGDGRVFFVERNVTAKQRRDALADRLNGLSAKEAASALKTAPVHLTVALDAATGKVCWQRPFDLTGAVGGAYWSALATMYRNGVLLIFGVFSDGHYWQQFFAKQFESRRMLALSARDGQKLWAKHIGYRVRPLIINDTLHAEPWAYDLRTGAQKTRVNPITGRKEPWQFARPGHHCGCPSACPNVMFFRSGYIAYYDLAGDGGTMHWGAQRPGCWINFIPANGLALIPEASSGCMCPFAIQCTIVLKPRKQNKSWTKYSLTGKMTPVKHLALNLGGPGDRKDASGTMWLSYPRPGGSLVLRFTVGTQAWPGGGFFKQNPDFVPIEGTTTPWLYTSGYRGLRRCEVPLFPPEDGTGLYTVRLGFAELENDKPGERVFDVKLNGKLVLKDFDLVKEAGGRHRAIVREFKGIEGAEKLTIDLAAKAAKPTPQQAPVLQTVEFIRESVLTLGFTVPSFLLNDVESEQTGEVRIANHKDEDFAGTLRVRAPQCFGITPDRVPVEVVSGGEVKVTLKASVLKKTKLGKYPARIQLLRQDGKVECERLAEIEYLADRGRCVLKAVADAHVGPSFANRGTSATLLVDGGNSKIGDVSHHIAYLRFKLDVPGKPLSAVLRIRNSSNPTSNGGNVCLVTEPWREKRITYATRPKPGKKLGNIGRVAPRQVLEVPLELSLEGMKELNLVIDPVNCDGTDYLARESGKPAELVVEYKP